MIINNENYKEKIDECLNPCFGGSWVMIPITIQSQKNWRKRS